MNNVFYLLVNDEGYEITCRGYNIIHIVRLSGTNHRREVEYESLTDEVKDAIITKIIEKSEL